MDISVTFPDQGRIRLESQSLFADPESEGCRRFLERVFLAEEITNVSIQGGPIPRAELHYAPQTHALKDVVAKVASILTEDADASQRSPNGDGAHLASGAVAPTNRLAAAAGSGHDSGNANGNGNGHFHGQGNGNGNGHALGAGPAASAGRMPSAPSGNGHASGNGRANGAPVPPKGRAIERRGKLVARAESARDRRGVVRFYRQDTIITGWRVVREAPGRLKLKNPVLYRKSDLCQAIDRELMSLLGIDRFSTNSIRCTVVIDYDPRHLNKAQILEILDNILNGTEHPTKLDKLDLDLPICTASVPFAATAQFAAPALLPAAAMLFAFTSIRTFKEAKHTLVVEKRLGVDVLDAIVVIGCLATMSVFPGAILCWCLSFGRALVKKTEDQSKKLLLNAFGKQPRFVWLLRDGVEVQVSMDTLSEGDIIVVNTGEVVPVDGVITEGMSMIDQHALTGESTPAEKGVGDRVFASTLMVAGKIHVAVEKSGSETASAKIGQILSDTAGYKLSSQHKGERLADKAVIPTLAVGSVGYAVMGPGGAVAVLNSDFGTGIRMAAPLAMLSSLALCANKGILVKDGRALELMNEVDTVLFDKTGTLTRERPEVGRVLAADGFDPERILLYAAAAEKKFHHPIALAILHKAEEAGLDLPDVDDTQYKVGYGITVHLDGHTIRVGSKRFIENENIPIPPEIAEALETAHVEGYTMVMVAVDNQLGGAIELQAAVRPEVKEIVEGLRKRGIKHIAIISGDHDAPTRKLAAELGMDRYFAQVLPADKADYVQKLQDEGRKVCFVGDGINDSIALKQANVSISLRGASSIATDTAHIIFLEEGLSKLCELRDIAHELERNVKRSWRLILAPNIACIFGVFTMGFGIMASVLTNNVAAMAALGNGVLPLRQISKLEAERKRKLEATADAAASAAAHVTAPLETKAGAGHGLERTPV